MKRANLVLDEQLLEEATRLSGEKTYSRTVERALEEFVKRIKARQILDLAGSGAWEGELSTMREDAKGYAAHEPAERYGKQPTTTKRDDAGGRRAANSVKRPTKRTGKSRR